MTYSLKPLK